MNSIVDNERVEDHIVRDLSWMLIGIDRSGSGHILDAANDFYDLPIIEPYADVEEAGVIIPKNIRVGNVYLVTNIVIRGGEIDNIGEYWGPEISGDWECLLPSMHP